MTTSRLPRWARATLVCATILAASAAGGMALMGTATLTTALSGAALGAILAGNYATYRWMRPFLGRVTAMAALALVGALTFTLYANLAPVCPAVGAVARCTREQAAVWTVAGALTPVSYLLLLMPFAALVAGARRVGRWSRAKVTARRTGRP